MDRSQRSLQNAIKSRDDRISAIPTLVADAEARVEQRMERERQQHDTTVEAMKQKFARQQELISGFDKSVQEIKRLKVRLSKGSFGCKVAPHIKGERESVCVCVVCMCLSMCLCLSVWWMVMTLTTRFWVMATGRHCITGTATGGRKE